MGTKERENVVQHSLALRVVQDVVVHLGIPPHLDRRLERARKPARQMRVREVVVAGEQKQERRFDAPGIGGHRPLRPPQPAPPAPTPALAYGRGGRPGFPGPPPTAPPGGPPPRRP